MKYFRIFGLPLITVTMTAAMGATAITPTRPTQLWFEPNRGQVPGQTQWIARSPGAVTYITGTKVVFALMPDMSKHSVMEPGRTHNITMRLLNAAEAPDTEGEELLDSYSNHFSGKTSKDWFVGIPHYAKVRYKNVYPGIDLIYYSNGQNLEYDFEVAAGADPGQIELSFSEDVRIEKGDLLISGIRQHRPKVFQNGREIAAAYQITSDNHVTLALAKFDRRERLTIDPVLEFATFLGGPGDENVRSIAFDKAGFVYLGGYTQTPAAPILDPFQQPSVVVYAPIIFKFSADGQKLIFYTTIDSNSYGWINAMAIDSGGRMVTTGGTWATNFPLKDAFITDRKAIYTSGFVTKFSPDGRSILFSSLLGGSVEDLLHSIALDATDNFYISGLTQSKDFPVKNAFQPAFAGGYRDCFLTKISSAGVMTFSTYFGSSGTELCDGLALAPDGGILMVGGADRNDLPLKNALQTEITPYIGQRTAFLAKFTPDGQLAFSTFFGGPISSFGSAVATDTAGNIYIGGSAASKFITRNAFQPVAPPGGYPAFVAKFDAEAKNLIYATYLGGSAYDQIFGIGVDPNGSAIVGGQISSPDFPVKNPFQSFRGGGLSNSDIFVAKLSPAGDSLIYSTPIGGGGGDQGGYLTLDADGNAYVGGISESLQDFPTKNPFQKGYGGGRWDAVFFKISDNTAPAPSPLSVQPGRLLFNCVDGRVTPSLQSIEVSSTGPVQVFTAVPSDPWLRLSSSSGSTPASVTIWIEPAGLEPGTYNGTIRLAPLSGNSATIDVTLTVQAAGAILTGVTPALVPIGSDDLEITVRGSNFTRASTLLINGVPRLGTQVVFVDANTLRTTLPKSYLTVEYNHTLAVQNPNAALSNVIALAVGRPAPQVAYGGVVNAASYGGGSVSPGEIITVFGSNFGGIENTSVWFDLVIPAKVIYVTPSQLGVTVPYEIDGLGKTSLIVESQGLRSAPVNLDVIESAPGLFTADSSGKGQGAILNSDGSVNGPANPALPGSIIVLYGTGGGRLTKDPLPRLDLPVSVTIGGIDAEVSYAGVAPGLAQGAIQVNVKVPAAELSGTQPVILQIGDQRSRSDVTVSIQ